MEVHQRRITRKVIIRGINTKVRVGNSGARHVKRIDNLLEIGRRAIRRDVVSEYGEGVNEGKKSKTHCIFNQRGQQIT